MLPLLVAWCTALLAVAVVAQFTPNGADLSPVLLWVLPVSLIVAGGMAFWRTGGRLLAVATAVVAIALTYSRLA